MNWCISPERACEHATNLLIWQEGRGSVDLLELLACVADSPDRIRFIVGDEQ